MQPIFVTTPTGARIATYDTNSQPPPRIFVVGGMSGRPIAESALAEALLTSEGRGTMMDIASSGESRHGKVLSMDTWIRDVEHVFEQRVASPAIWIGASIGAWLMMLVHRRRPEWFTAMCGLAPAFDWDREYVAAGLKRGTLADAGELLMSGRTPLAPRSLIASMPPHHLLGAPFHLGSPLHVLFGGRDEIAPPEPVKRFLQATTGARCTAEYSPDADHGIAKLAQPAVRERFNLWLSAALRAPSRQ